MVRGDRVSGAHRVLDHVERFVMALCAFLIVVIAVVVMWQVVSRYIAGTSATWAPEFAAIAFVWLSMLALAVGIRGHRHLHIDLLGRIGRRYRWLALVTAGIGGLVVIVSFALLAYYGIQGVELALNRTLPGTGFSYSWVASAVPVGAALAVIFAIETLVRDMKRDEPLGEPETTEDEEVML